MKELYLEKMGKWSQIGSWAIWNEQDYKDTSIIIHSAGKLRNDIVIVGLNVSKEINEDWQNFHAGKNDLKLKQLFNNSSYEGAYMTDIIKEKVEVKSNNLMKSLTNEILQANILKFRNEMADLGADDSTLFILLGKDVEKLFCQELRIFYRNTVTLQHPAARLSDSDFLIESKGRLNSHFNKVNDFLKCPVFESSAHL
jgi:hypothetical protein